jgi:hypothetical protein
VADHGRQITKSESKAKGATESESEQRGTTKAEVSRREQSRTEKKVESRRGLLREEFSLSVLAWGERTRLVRQLPK